MQGNAFTALCEKLNLMTFDSFIVILGAGENKLSQIEGRLSSLRLEKAIPGNLILEMRIEHAYTPIPNASLYTAVISVAHITSLVKKAPHHPYGHEMQHY
ncbi:MAG: hypothetical protein RLZ12_437 [Bacillota bacterium]